MKKEQAIIKNKDTIEKYIVENKGKTLNLNLKLAYSGTAKVLLNLKKESVKKQILYIGSEVQGVSTITIENLILLSSKELKNKIRKKLIVTTPEQVLLINKKVLSPINKSRKLKSIKILKEKPSKESIEALAKEIKVTIVKKACSLVLGKEISLKKIEEIISQIEEQLNNHLKKVSFKCHIYSTFDKGFAIIRK